MQQDKTDKEVVIDSEAEKRFLDLARKAVSTPVTEDQKREEQEYMAKHFPPKKPRPTRQRT